MKSHSATEQIRTNQKLSKMYCISSYGACEHKAHSGVCFEAKQIRVGPGVSSHNLKEKKFCCGHKIWVNNVHEKLGPENQVQIIEKST